MCGEGSGGLEEQGRGEVGGEVLCRLGYEILGHCSQEVVVVERAEDYSPSYVGSRR